jgi:FkbM family methyltransferase
MIEDLPSRRRATLTALVLLGLAFADLVTIVVPTAGQQGDVPQPREDILGTGKKLYSQHDEELVIRDFFQDRRHGTFLDVGCAWPIKASNTFYLEQRLGWRGIAVDALPDYEQAWRKRRRRSRFFNYLVTDHAGTFASFFRSELLGVSTIKPPEEFEGRKLKYDEIRVPTITLNQLLDENEMKKVDFVSMDIEGAELLALAGFDIERFKPELLCIEAKPQNRAALMQYFATHGYERIERYFKRDQVNYYFAPKLAERSLGLQ